MKYALFTILFCLAGYAQEAYVVPLAPADAAHARAAYERLQQAQKDWDDEQKDISRKYLIVEPSDPDASGEQYVEESLSGSGLAAGVWLSNSVTVGGCGYVGKDGKWVSVDCSSPQAAAEIKEGEQEHEKQEKEWMDRYAREKRQRKGFNTSCSNCLPKFDFSRDFKFIVPPKPTAAPAQFNYPWGSWPHPL